MSGSVHLALVPLVPLVGAAGIALAARRRNLREGISCLTAAALLLVVLPLGSQVAAGARPAHELGAILPGITFGFRLEPLGMLFALVASTLWLVTSIYSIGYMRAHHEAHQTRFYVCFAVAISATMGIALAANMFTLFVFYEMLTLSTYPLVIHSGTDEARRAGRIYLITLLGTSIGLLLVAMGWTFLIAGTLDFVPGGVLRGNAPPGVIGVLFVLYVFGIGKSAIMPLHRWLPAAMVAPTPVSALLHAVAVVKAGVFTVCKVSVYLFGQSLLSELGAPRVMLYLAAFTMIAAGVIALREENLKRRLAYSTVSQLSHVLLGVLLLNAAGLLGAGLHIVMHAFGKITLFFGAGAILVATHRTEVSELDGLGRRMPITMGMFTVGTLSVVGLPPAGGMWSKWHLALGTLQAQEPVLLAALLVGTLLSVGYLGSIVMRAFFAPSADAHECGIREAPWPCLVAMVLSATGAIALFFFPEPVYLLVDQVNQVGELSRSR